MTAHRCDSAHNILFLFLTSVMFFPHHATFSSCISMAPKIDKHSACIQAFGGMEDPHKVIHLRKKMCFYTATS